MSVQPNPKLRARRGRGTIVAAAAACLLGLGACTQGSSVAETASTQNAETKSKNVKKAKTSSDKKLAPAFALKNLQGEEVKFSEFEGKVVLIDFWATWCGPCRMEIPHLKELYSRYSDDGFELVGISLDRAGPSVVKPFVKKNQIPYTILMGDESTAKSYGGVNAIPTAFLIDREGRVVKKYVGYKPLETFVADIEPLM